jgi:hypothetical protein
MCFRSVWYDTGAEGKVLLATFSNYDLRGQGRVNGGGVQDENKKENIRTKPPAKNRIFINHLHP